jgi:diacylglycerol kinase (ATP)
MKTYTFIINPMAGKGRGKKLLATLRERIKRTVPDAEIVVTERRLHALEIARERNHDADRVVVAVGGDGTVNEVGNGLVNGNATMGVIPIGSGNDFIKMFSIPLNIEKALDRILHGTVRPSDTGFVEIRSADDTTVDRYFLNGIGIGFDAAVAHQTTKFKHLKGFGLYVVSVAAILFRYKTPGLLMSMNGMSMNGNHFLIAVGNGTCAGGGFYLTPDAKIDDGLLDVCLVDDISVPQVLRIFPSVMKGKHQKHGQVHFYRTDSLRVEARQPIMIHADGEVLSTGASEIAISVRPGTLQVIA